MKRQFRLMEHFGMTEEPVFSLPLVEIWGNERVLIERHGGVIEYKAEKITVRVQFGSVSVTGTELKLCRMCAQQLVISGNIMSITLNREVEV